SDRVRDPPRLGPDLIHLRARAGPGPRRPGPRRDTSPGGTMTPRRTIALVAALVVGMSPPDGPRKRTWDFTADRPGRIADGCTSEVGTWVVQPTEGNNLVLAQTAQNDDRTFNVALVTGTSYKDLDLSVRLRAVEGKNDQGGGLVWRAKDAKNYYIARYNPLEP